MKNNENGRSMIEMLGVLAIIGVLSVGGIAGYTKAMEKYRINRTIEEVTHLSQNIRTFYSTARGANKYSSLAVSSHCFSGSVATSSSGVCSGALIVQKAKLLPDEMYGGSGSGLENAFGGKVNISGGSTFAIELTGVPEEACVEVATQNWESVSSGIVMVGIAVGSNNVTNYCAKNYSNVSCGNNKLPIGIDVAASACNGGENHRIIFTYK